MTKIIAIAVIAATILLAGTAVVYAQTTSETPLQHMPMWGNTDGTNGNYYDEMLDYCVTASGTAENAQEHYQQMEEHMQDGTWQDHMGDGTYQDHMGEGTHQEHMGDGTHQEHMGDGTWQDHHGTTGSDTSDSGTGTTGGYGHMGSTGNGGTGTTGYGHIGDGMGM